MSETEQRRASRPPRFLADENMNGAIIRGARRKRPSMIFLTANEAGTRHLSDPEVLQRAKELDLILISHDRATLDNHFAEFLMRMPAGEYSPGLFLITQKRYGIGQIIEFILEVYDASSHEEWRNLNETLPL